ncbi:hypothetical protein [Vibrio mediterranei]|uniref:hypothetical protein n=1 Tax=Vibrio mediterranei TaxID=689 RepID=UPI0040684C67
MSNNANQEMIAVVVHDENFIVKVVSSDEQLGDAHKCSHHAISAALDLAKNDSSLAFQQEYQCYWAVGRQCGDDDSHGTYYGMSASQAAKSHAVKLANDTLDWNPDADEETDFYVEFVVSTSSMGFATETNFTYKLEELV